MPLTGEAKLEYQRTYMRRRHGFAPRREGKRDSKGDLDPTLDPHKKGDFRPVDRAQIQDAQHRDFSDFRPTKSKQVTKVPSWVSAAPRPFQGKAAQAVLEYMIYINGNGQTLDLETGEMQEMFPNLAGQLLATQQKLASLEADILMQRAEAVLGAHL